MTIKEAAQSAIRKAIGGDKNHGWGVEDSCAVIAALIENETGGVPDEALMSAIKEVVNPSAFRQKLEKAEMLNKGERREKAASGLLDGLM